MIQAPDIEQLSLEERFQAMELVWASIARAPDAVQSPSWHGDEIAYRLRRRRVRFA